MRPEEEQDLSCGKPQLKCRLNAMPWSSDEDEDCEWTLEANAGRAAYDARQLGIEWHDELWTLYRATVEYSQSQGFPFFPNNRLSFNDFADFVLAHS